MSWVSIDQEKCNQCALCVTRCPVCYSKEDGAITVEANEATCVLCGHCVSVCATEAIHHEKMDMDNFPLADRRALPDTESFIRFLRGRRSHRHFKDRPVPRAELEKLVDICRYAPTGSNKQAVEIKILQDPDRIKLLSDHTVDYFMNMIGSIEAQVEALESEGKEVPKNLEQLAANMSRYKTMGSARELGVDVIFRGAPCVMVFHASSRKATSPKDDCVIAAQTVSMLARTMKLESCYIGLFTAAAESYPPVVEAIKLPAHSKVHSVLILGYPKITYLREVDRNPIEVTWE